MGRFVRGRVRTGGQPFSELAEMIAGLEADWYERAGRPSPRLRGSQDHLGVAG